MSSHKSNLDLRANQLQNAVLHVLASAPANPIEGQMYYDSTKKKALIWTGTAWAEWGGSLSTPLNISYFFVSISNPQANTGQLITRIYQNMTILRIDSHLLDGDRLSFNIQERNHINDSGPTVMNSAIETNHEGVTVTTFDDDLLAADRWLYLEIGEVAGTVGILTVTITCTCR